MPAHPRWRRWGETCRVGQRAQEGRGSQLCRAQAVVPGGSLPVALSAAGLLSKRSLLLAGSSQARATDSPVYQSWGTLPLTR